MSPRSVFSNKIQICTIVEPRQMSFFAFTRNPIRSVIYSNSWDFNGCEWKSHMPMERCKMLFTDRVDIKMWICTLIVHNTMHREPHTT